MSERRTADGATPEHDGVVGQHDGTGYDQIIPRYVTPASFAIIRAAMTGGDMVGERLGQYEITSHLGSGGMGDVYQASDTRLGRSVAIKLLPDAFSDDTERVARF